MNPEAMHDVFITYSHSDADAAAVVAESLRQEGLQVSLDRASLIPGVQWHPSIPQAMMNSRSVVVCIGLSGLDEWQQSEIEDTFGSLVEEKVRISVIPVLVPGALLESLLIPLSGFAWVDFRDNLRDSTALRHLIAAINATQFREELSRELEAGDDLRDASDFTRARMHYERALKIARTTYGDNHLVTADLWANLGNIAKEEGNYLRAHQYLRAALSVRGAIFGGDAEQLSTTWNDLGRVLNELGKLDESESFLRRALTADEKTLGRDHPAVVNLMVSLGDVLRKKGQYEQALTLFQRALMIDQRTLGPEHLEVANRLTSMGLILRDMGRREEALKYLHDALAIQTKAMGPDHPVCTATLQRIASVAA